MISEAAARRAGYFIVSLAALAVVTCASAARAPEPARAPETPVGSSVPPLPAPASEPKASAAPAPKAPAAPRALGPDPALRRFRAALGSLSSGSRKEPVRVLWLGDSHAAADFWPDAVRKPLQARYGSGGPGFLFVGLGVYRHAGVKVEREGKWHFRPKQPSLWMRQDDGVFGLGGIRVLPEAGTSRVRLTLQKDSVRGDATWDVAFRLPHPRSSFQVRIEGGETLAVDSAKASPGAVAHFTWKTRADATVSIQDGVENPEIFGVVVEGTVPGVVVDTLGINGARIGTPLAWDEDTWVSEAQRRAPALFVLAYGTNEVGDALAPRKYGPELASLIARVRKAAPDGDCLVVGPTDRAGPDFSTLPRVTEIESVERDVAASSGCAYWSAFEAMGGEGSLRRWASEDPPMAAADRVHLTPRGYGELGSLLLGTALGEPVSRAP